MAAVERILLLFPGMPVELRDHDTTSWVTGLQLTILRFGKDSNAETPLLIRRLLNQLGKT